MSDTEQNDPTEDHPDSEQQSEENEEAYPPLELDEVQESEVEREFFAIDDD